MTKLKPCPFCGGEVKKMYEIGPNLSAVLIAMLIVILMAIYVWAVNRL